MGRIRAKAASVARLFLGLALLGAAAEELRAQALGAPTGLVASDGAYSTKISLAWEHTRGATLYRIFRAQSPDPGAATDVGNTASILFYDPHVSPGVTYYYWVRAESAGGASQLSAPDSGYRASGLNANFGPISPLGPPDELAANPTTGAKVYLGKALFWDEQLSSTRTTSCGTCHFPRKGGSDPRSLVGSAASLHPGADGRFGTDDDVVGSAGVPRSHADGSYAWEPSFGIRPQVTRRKAQSVFEAAYADEGLFWDGRALPAFVDPLTGETLIARGASLESQALMPLLSVEEMSHEDRTWEEITTRIAESTPLALSPQIPAALSRWIGGRSYPELFAEAFGSEQVTPVRIAMAIAAYERTLYSDQSLIDLYTSKIVPEPSDVARGRALFLDLSCDICHRDAELGDHRFRFIGVTPEDEDLGREEVTGRRLDRGRFRTASLRNIGLRGPYMHNGSLETLEDVVEFYNRGGDFDGPNKDANFVRKLRLTDREKADLVEFLHALTDPRVAAEAAPLFDRPALYGDSARVPKVPAQTGAAPKVLAIEPPLLGNPNMTIGLYDARPGARAVLAIDGSDPGAGAAPQDAELALVETTVAPEGYASIPIAIPNDPALVGRTFFGRWYVAGAITAPFEMTIFAPADTAVDEPRLSSVSAGSLLTGLVAPESIVSGFGAGLASGVHIAETLPLPTTLGGVRVVVTDSAGMDRNALLFFVSPTQINYLVPAGTAPGEARVRVEDAPSGAIGTLQVTAVAPALFTANANGRGVAAAVAERFDSGGGREVLPVAVYDEPTGAFLPVEIDLGGAGDQVIVTFFGTGFRSADPADVRVVIGGLEAEVLYAGPQPEFAGLDQINVRLPADLAGRGVVDVRVNIGDRTANLAEIGID